MIVMLSNVGHFSTASEILVA